MKYDIDQWVLYDQFPGVTSIAPKRAVILEVLTRKDIYDYRIFIDGEGNVRKVKEETLCLLPENVKS